MRSSDTLSARPKRCSNSCSEVGSAQCRSSHTSTSGRSLMLDDMHDWMPGDLVRFYGDVVRVGDETVVDARYIRYWPRWAYEVAPARPVRDAAGSVRRLESGGWKFEESQSVVASEER